MRSHVRKKNGRYCIVIELDRDPATGKRRQQTSYGLATSNISHFAFLHTKIY